MDENEKKIEHIQKALTPIVLKEGEPGYDTMLDIEKMLDDPVVFNIAVTGPYGSGKSTILRTLEKHDSHHNYLTISLASLTGTDWENPKKELSKKEQQRIEYSILQQLIYREKPQTLPNSRFRRLGKKTVWNAVWFALSIVLLIVCFFVVFEPEWLRVDTFCGLFDFGYKWNLVADIICATYMFVYVFKVVAYLYRHSGLHRIRALNVKNVTIDLNQESSVFNKHLEEIVYFFEATEYDVVIIEDLDRFRCSEIFQKLREINFILRKSKVIEDKQRKVRFIYAIKDDLFKDTERTKFFDYIATVTPVVNPDNSYEKLSQEFEERGYKFDAEKLKELSEFVDDMRMLKNIANEFQQYMERITASSDPDYEKLLAMIIYKNHHPNDFGDLHYRKGKIYSFISKKNDWIKIAINKAIVPRREVWEQKKREALDAQRFNLYQWRVIYMKKYEEHLPSYPNLKIIVKDKECTITDLCNKEELFEALIKENNVVYRYIDQYNRPQRGAVEILASNIAKEVQDNLGYESIKRLSDEDIDIIESEIKALFEEEVKLRNYKLYKLLLQFPEIQEDDDFKKIGLSELMFRFLLRGYIDETYYDYLSIYDGKELSLDDRHFVSRVKQNQPGISFDDKIDDIKGVVDKLPIFVYDYKGVLNYQIADYLETHPVEYKNALMQFENHFVNSSNPPLDFLADYYIKGGDGVVALWKKYVNAKLSWQRIQTYDKQDRWDILVEAWLKYCEPSNINSIIINWLNSHLDFCIERLAAIGLQHLKEIIVECKFVELSTLGPIGGTFQGDDVIDLANYIFDKRLFEITDKNIYIGCVLTSSPFDDLKGVEYVTFSDILCSGNDGFKEYIIDNIKMVFDNIIFKSKGQETECGLIGVLNQEEIEDAKKIIYLKRQKKEKVHDINDINEPYMLFSILGKVLNPSWMNILVYYAHNQGMISGELEDFINENADVLAGSSYPNDVEGILPGEIVFGTYLENSSYKKLLPVLFPHTNEDDELKMTTAIGIERASMLVDNNYLSNRVETAKTISELSSPLYARYLSHHIISFISNYDEYDKDTKTLSLLLKKTSSITNGQRWSLAKCMTPDMISTDSELADALLALMYGKKDELSVASVNAVLQKASPNSAKMDFQKWLIKRHKDSVEIVTAVLKTMPKPYKEIADASKRPLIPVEFKEYLDIIKPLGLFTTCSPDGEKGYRIYRSTK